MTVQQIQMLVNTFATLQIIHFIVPVILVTGLPAMVEHVMVCVLVLSAKILGAYF